MDALAVAQRKMERIMLGITLRDQRHNTWIRQQTGVTDIIDHIRQSKHRWAGHVALLSSSLQANQKPLKIICELRTVHKFQRRGGGWQNMGGSPVFNECIWGGHSLFRQSIGGS